jgi:hypothetical protein
MDDNDFEVEEVTPLLPEGQQPGEAEPSGLEPEVSRSRRKRVTQVGLVLAALLAVVIIVQSVLSPANPTPNGQTTPQPTPNVPMALIESNITFGTVTINGQRQRGKLPMLFAARNNTYRITIDAPPFSSQSCALTFIDGTIENGGSCNYAAGGLDTITANGVTAAPSFAILLNFNMNNLPQDQQDQINTLLAQAVQDQQTTTVPTGSYIVTSFKAANTITSQRVTTSVQATASLFASLNFWQQGNFGCLDYACPAAISPAELALLTGSVWAVAVPVALRWRFTTPDGQTLGGASFPATNTQEELLTYSRAAGWSLAPQAVAQPFSDPNVLSNTDCQTGTQVLQQQTQTATLGYNIFEGQGIAGCKVMLLDQTGGANGSFIWRFGVLLAADSAAHKLLPHLPIAPQAEIDAVQA